MLAVLLFLIQCIQHIDMNNDFFQSGLLFASSVPQRIQTGDVICIPMDVMSMQAILLSSSSGIIVAPKLKSIDGNQTITFTSRGYLYVQSSLPLLSPNQRCFQVDLGSSNLTGQIQFIYKTENSTTPIDPCAIRRVKCKNGGQCQALPNGQTECLCPENASGIDCENSKLNFCLKRNRLFKSIFSWYSMYKCILYQSRNLFIGSSILHMSIGYSRSRLFNELW